MGQQQSVIQCDDIPITEEEIIESIPPSIIKKSVISIKDDTNNTICKSNKEIRISKYNRSMNNKKKYKKLKIKN